MKVVLKTNNVTQHFKYKTGIFNTSAIIKLKNFRLHCIYIISMSRIQTHNISGDRHRKQR
jgi:hypothetical protein